MSIILDALLHSAINPALRMLPPKMDSDRARCMMLATTLQEADAIHRYQHEGGPAHGLWQFEQGGAVRGVMRHVASRELARAICDTLRIPWDAHAIWLKLPHNDVLAAGFARLLLFTHPKPLPELDAPDDETWEYYRWLWRPGKPHREKWQSCHAAARAQVLS